MIDSGIALTCHNDNNKAYPYKVGDSNPKILWHFNGIYEWIGSMMRQSALPYIASTLGVAA